MGNRLVITNVYDRKISALFEDDRLTEVNVATDEASGSATNGAPLPKSVLGNIYVGRVENVVKNINAAFIEISKGEKCYYSLTENEHPIFLNRKNNDKVNVGDLILVQVVRDTIKTKMAVASSDINIAGHFVVATLSGNVCVSAKITDRARREHLTSLLKDRLEPQTGMVIRTCAMEADDENIVNEALELQALLLRILEVCRYRPAFTCLYNHGKNSILSNVNIDSLEKIVTDDTDSYGDCLSYITKICPNNLSKLTLYEDKLLPLSKLYSLESRLEAALKKRVWLKSGGYLVIEPTEALTVIDVNTGKFDGKKADREATFFKVNMEAAKEIAYQLRLRNYSGIILVDFIDMESKENNQELMKHFGELLALDKVKTTLVDMTRLGLCEITRKRVKRPLHEEFRRLENYELQNSDI